MTLSCGAYCARDTGFTPDHATLQADFIFQPSAAAAPVVGDARYQYLRSSGKKLIMQGHERSKEEPSTENREQVLARLDFQGERGGASQRAGQFWPS